jgi:hypothetical protein
MAERVGLYAANPKTPSILAKPLVLKEPSQYWLLIFPVVLGLFSAI